MKPALAENENIINTWTIMYQPPSGGRFNGKLFVTNLNLFYDAQFDVSAQGILNELMFVQNGNKTWLRITKERIVKTEMKKSFFSKQVLITLDNGEVHTFNYGMLNVNPVYEAIAGK
jgi:hypothetical protein